MKKLGKMAVGDQQKRFDGQENLDEAKKLLVANTSKDNEILKQLGLNDHELDSKLKSVGEYNRISMYEKTYGFCVTKEILEQLAYDYDLTLAESKYYKYSVPISITSDIKEWSKKTDVNVSDSNSFYILAPSESFYTKNEYIKCNGVKQPCNGSDPMLVHEIAGSSASGGQVYSIITEWGSDLNVTRKIKSFIVNNLKTATVIGVAGFIFFITSLMYFIINSMTLGFVGNDWVTIIMTVLTFVGTAVVLSPIINIIEPTNVRRKNFDYEKVERNFKKFEIFEYYTDDRSEFTSEFANVMGRFSIVSVVLSVFFFMFFAIGSTSFANQLGLSGWYFTIPLLASISLWVISLISKVFENLK